mmetsp:Transcript_34400/g.67004  ORF Transcript_34400/g.67004 Transcript_34400/m.67004 type:complete len:178 (+) Transcript_34400:104-637(+)
MEREYPSSGDDKTPSEPNTKIPMVERAPRPPEFTDPNIYRITNPPRDGEVKTVESSLGLENPPDSSEMAVSDNGIDDDQDSREEARDDGGMSVSSGSRPEPLSCQLCRRTFDSRRNLQMHLLSHRESPYVCGWCNKSFHSRGNLNQHLPVMSSARPFILRSCCINTFFVEAHRKLEI